jgi:hypothetical protein
VTWRARTGPARVSAPRIGQRPKASYLRFAAGLLNECWQSDFIHWDLAGGVGIEIVTWLDDHSRYALSVTARPVRSGQSMRGL